MSTERTSADTDTVTGSGRPGAGMGVRLAVAWTVVGVPLAYGIFETAKKAAALFTG